MPRLLFGKRGRNEGNQGHVRAVVYNAREWNRIIGHITGDEAQRKEATTKTEERAGRLQMSRQMASTWGNTLVNLRRKRIAQRQEKIENEIKARHERYLYFKAEDEKRKDLIRTKARKTFFEMRDSTKNMRSAEKLSEVLRERSQHAAFNKQLKEKDNEAMMEEAKKIWADVEKWKMEQEEVLGQRSKRKEERKKEALEELEKYRKEQREKFDEQKKQELRELDGMKKELEQIDKFEKEEVKKEIRRRHRIKLEYWKNVQENRETTREKRQAAVEESKEEDLAIQIINEGKAKLAQLRKEKKAELLKEGVKRREKVASLVVAAAKNKEELEQAILMKASLEKEKIFKQDEEKRKKYAEKMRVERIQTHQEYLKDIARRKEAERELIKWAILQRFKNSETTINVQKKINDVRHRRYLECREANAKLLVEQNTKKAKEKQEDLDAVRKAAAIWALHDKEFLDLATHVRDECVKAGRPSYPLEVCILDFKKRNGLLKKCRDVGYIDAIPIVPGYNEIATKLKETNSKENYKSEETDH